MQTSSTTSSVTSGNSVSNGASNTEEDRTTRKKEESKEAIKIIQEMSSILNTGLDSEALGLCVRLCENGANPHALAQVIKGWRQQKSQESASNNGNF